MKEKETPQPRTILKIDKDDFVPKDIELPIYLSSSDVSDEELPGLEKQLVSLVRSHYAHIYFRRRRENEKNIKTLRIDQIKTNGLTLIRNFFSFLRNRKV